MLLIDAARLDDFAAIARRERCPFAVLGEIDDTGVLVLEDKQHGTRPVDLPLEVLLGKAPKMLRDVRRVDAATGCVRRPPRSTCAKPPIACCASRPWPTRRS